MKSTAKTLALGAALLCLLAGGMALPASAAVPLTGTAVSLPWNSDNSVPAESIEAGTYSSNMLLGETQQLSPTVRPRNSTDSVIYLTDDSSVLTVSNSGVVQAVGVGTATVTAAAGNQICAYTISVSMDSTMIVTEMDLALSSNTIYVGNSVSASLQVRPSSASQYATISLTSSNEKVATVNSFGRVTGVSPGTATITAACGSVTASTTVTVLAIPTEATTGGTELGAWLLKAKIPGLSIGTLCLAIDLTIIVFYAAVFRSLENALYGGIALYISTKVMDMVVYGGSAAKLAYIISNEQEKITHELLARDMGVTRLTAEGAYTHNDKPVLLCAVRRREIVAVKRLVNEIDPTAFFIVCDAREVLGEGFGEYKPDGL